MRLWLLMLAASCLFIASARAQVSVEIVLDQEQFLKDESMPVKVRITNRSGQTLKFPRDSDWLSFFVESRDGHPAVKLRDVPGGGEFSLESAAIGTRRVDLMPCFDFSNTGRYTIGATLKVPEWDREFTAKPVGVEVVRGTKVWEQEFGVPVKQGPPETRKYILQQARFLKDLTLYVRVTDAGENRTFRIFPAGTVVSFNRSETQVDRESKLHLLFQTGARTFIYNVVSPDGDVLLRHVYDHSGGPAVRLKLHEDGYIFVSGGTRRMKADEVTTPTNEVKRAKS